MGINSGNYGTPEQDRQNELLRQFIQGAQSRSEGQQAAQLKDQQTQKDIGYAKQLNSDQGTGGMSKVGDVTLGMDPTVANLHKVQAQTGHEATALDSAYQKQVQPLHDMAAQLHTGVQGLTNGTASGDEMAAIIKARMAEGKGSRLLGSVISSFGAPKTLESDAQGLANYITGTPATKMTPAQREAVASLYDQQIGTVKGQLDNADTQWRQKAAGIAPGMAASGALAGQLNNYGNPGAKHLQDAAQMLADFRAGKIQGAPSPSVAGAPPEQLGDKLTSFFHNMLGNSRQTAATPAPPTHIPMDAIQAELARRKAAQGAVPGSQ